MVQLTPIGKITIAIIVLLIAYFFVLPLFSLLFFGENQVERKREIKIVAFLKTFDRNSARLQETFRELKRDENMHGLIALSLINVEAEPGKMEQYNIQAAEVPSFILGNKKFHGWYSKEWFKEKILEIASQTQ